MTRWYQALIDIYMCRNRYTKVIDNKVLTILRSETFNPIYFITVLVNGPEREIQQFDWFLSGLELAVPDC